MVFEVVVFNGISICKISGRFNFCLELFFCFEKGINYDIVLEVMDFVVVML